MPLSLQTRLTATARFTALIIVGSVVGYLLSSRPGPVATATHTARPAKLALHPAVAAKQTDSGSVRIVAPQAAAAPTLAAAHQPQAQQADAAAIAIEYLLEGRDLISVGQWAAAVEAFQLAVEIDSSAETNGALGSLYFRLAAASRAYAHLNRAVEMDPYDANRWIALANVLQLRGNPAEARQALRRARQIEPGLSIEHDSSGFAYRADQAPDTVFHASRYIPSDITRRTPG